MFLFFFFISSCDDHLSPSGTIERARQLVESASRSILANSAAQKLDRDNDSVFVDSRKPIVSNKGIIDIFETYL